MNKLVQDRADVDQLQSAVRIPRECDLGSSPFDFPFTCPLRAIGCLLTVVIELTAHRFDENQLQAAVGILSDCKLSGPSLDLLLTDSLGAVGSSLAVVDDLIA